MGIITDEITREQNTHQNTVGNSRTARWRGRCAWVCWRAAPLGFAWVALATLGIAPGITAATEGVAAFMVLLLLVFGQLWILLYVVGKPIENYRQQSV